MSHTIGQTLPCRTGTWRLSLVGLFLFVFAVVALSGPGRIDIVDGQTRYEVARSLVEHGDSVIRDKGVWFAVLPGRDGQPHTNYRFPQSGLGAVAIWLADATGPTEETRRHFFFTLISPLACALLALTYALWFRGLGHTPLASIGWAAAGIFCTPNWFYGTSTFDDMLATAVAVPAVAVAFLLRDRRPLLGAAASGLLLGIAFNCKQPMGLFLLPVLAIICRCHAGFRQKLVPMGLVLGGLALGVLAQRAYDTYKFPPSTGDVAVAAETVYGRVWVSDPLPGLASLTVSPAAGALWYCPTLLLSFVGWLRWRKDYSLFCFAVLMASLIFLGFLSFLTFFKGEPSWGPRYLTPVFALWWVFVPAAAAGMRRVIVVGVLTLGCVVQLLALGVDPQRLYLERGLPFNYYMADRWLGFDPAASHLWQRPHEIIEIMRNEAQAPEFAPGPVPTYAVTLPSGYPVVLASTIGLAAPLPGTAPLSVSFALPMRTSIHATAHAQAAVGHYHVFSSFRPWWISQQYLTPTERPVDLLATVTVLAGLGAAGLVLMLMGNRFFIDSENRSA